MTWCVFGVESISISIRCEAALTRVALGLKRFSCFTGRPSEMSFGAVVGYSGKLPLLLKGGVL